MARNNKIFVGSVDLGSLEAVTALVHELKQKGISLSVLDISNVWSIAFLGDGDEYSELSNLLQAFDKIASDESLLVTTDMKKRPDAERLGWQYSADTFKRIRSYESLKEFWRVRHQVRTKTILDYSVIREARPEVCIRIFNLFSKLRLGTP